MQEFVLIFRMDITTPELQPSASEMEIYMTHWTEWINGIANTGRLAGGNHLLPTGRILYPADIITEGTYQADNASVAGYIIVRCENMEEATSIAQQCPILNGEGTSVEIRMITMQ